ncbi:MAG: ParB/RepB/Spo0J family partition protein [Acutalibacteraceae bacterium]|jgi:ParB-like chromosome segregation protein Spo0J
MLRYKSAGKVWLIPTREILVVAAARQEESFAGLAALAESLNDWGMLHPLTVTLQNDRPVLVAGHRRLRAAKIAGWRQVPCLIVNADRLRMAALPLAENGQRRDLSAGETAAAATGLIRRFLLTGEEVARLIGRTPSPPAPAPAPEQKPPPAARPARPVVRDLRLFYNTLNHAVDTMRRGGIAAEIDQRDEGGFVELTVRMPKLMTENR